MRRRSKASIGTLQNIVSYIPTTPRYCTLQNYRPMSQFPSGLQHCINSKCMSQSQPGLQDYSTMSDCSQFQTGFMRQSQTCSCLNLKHVYRTIVPCLSNSVI